MKKLLAILLSVLSFALLTACSGGGSDETQDTTPKYSKTYSYNETHHWRAQTNGDGMTEYELHSDRQGRCKCGGKYYDPTDYLDFEYYDINYDGEPEGYMIVGYKDEEYGYNEIYLHYEIPTHYQGEDDDEPLPILAISYGAFGVGVINGTTYNSESVPIESIKLNDNLIEIRDWAFKGSGIEELIIPDSVTNEYYKSWGSNINSRIYNICGGCYKLKKVVIGNGLKALGSYNFSNSMTEITLGSSLELIQPRAFYEIYNLEYIVIPESVNHIPEGSATGGSYAQVPIISMFPITAKTVIFMEITKAEHDAMIIPLRQRDSEGKVLNPSTQGFVDGWSGNCKVYFKGEWHYDSNGKPVLN